MDVTSSPMIWTAVLLILLDSQLPSPATCQSCCSRDDDAGAGEHEHGASSSPAGSHLPNVDEIDDASGDGQGDVRRLDAEVADAMRMLWREIPDPWRLVASVAELPWLHDDLRPVLSLFERFGLDAESRAQSVRQSYCPHH